MSCKVGGYDSEPWSSSSSHEEEEEEEEEEQNEDVESLGIKCASNDVDEDEADDVDDDDDDDQGAAAPKSDCTSIDPDEDEEDEKSSWDDELQSFLEESPEFRAKVQYQVRVVAVMPAFESAGGRKESAFAHFYKLRFDRGLLEGTGFSSAQMLCKSMPHVIQRQTLEKQGQVRLVESAKNMRIVAGVRSGLRRIVFQILRRHPKGVLPSFLEEQCSKSMGRPLSMILTELAYDTPSVELMVRDMADIASFKQISGSGSRVFLSSEAEDPALTDGILIGMPAAAQFQGASPEEQAQEQCRDSAAANYELLQARLRMMVLLALHSRGIEMNRLQKTYAEMFTENLDPRMLGFSSMEDLARAWADLILVRGSKAFLRSSPDCYRLVGTLQSGLRLEVFSILMKRYPDGVEPAQILNELQECHAGELLDMYYGAESLKKQMQMPEEDRQLHMLCSMVRDMMDFVGFGCREDGALIVKLRDSSFPVLDFPECSNQEDGDDEFVELLIQNSSSKAAVVVAADRHPDYPNCEAGGDEQDHDEIEVPCSRTVVENRLRFIVGSPDYLESGLPIEEFGQIYEQRSGEAMNSDQLKSFVSKTPGLLRLIKDRLFLVESPKNLRMIQAAKAGLRQLLYWALLKNPGGVWSELLEGWFTDFTGYSLVKVLHKHGYGGAGSSPLWAVREFLEDMNDLCYSSGRGGFEFYVLACKEDPVEEDSRLLGMKIEYSPVKLCLTMESIEPSEQDVQRQQFVGDGEHSEISIEQEVPFSAAGISSSDEEEEEDDEDEEAHHQDENGEQNRYEAPKAYAALRVA